MDSDMVEELRERYAADGYLVSPVLLDARTVAAARAAASQVLTGRYDTGVDPLYRSWGPGDEPRSLVKVDLPHLSSRVLQQVVADPRVGAWAADILDARFVQLWACELICKYPEAGPGVSPPGVIGWHQDDHFWEHWAGEVCTLWLALVDIDHRMGPVRYVTGSHCWGPRDRAGFFFQGGLDEQRAKIGTPAGHRWTETDATMPAGAVSLHHRLTLHASGPSTGTHPRIGCSRPMPPEYYKQLGETRAEERA
jgi:hypothetical protein